MTHLDPSAWSNLTFRNIGPPRGGRVVAVAGHPTDRNVFYFGACAGGVWKTIDGGTYWENISDGFFNRAAVGAIAVSEADPNVIYVGTGESSIRGDVSWGDGVYKSTDGGRTWANVGLPDSYHIGAIRIHPQNPDVVYVAVLGHAFGPNKERGVYRSMDGGKHWAKVLHVSEKAGAVDLALDVTNPRILYATIWQVHRHFWELVSGGPDSGLWKSTDGGDTWTDITRNKGLPQEGILGKIGVTASPAQPGRVWAIVEAEGEKSGLYRSDDYGDTWSQLNSNRDLMARPWYYMHIFSDPQDPETVYVNNLRMWKSVDGGTNWREITTPHGDNHGLWIDPTDPQRMINGNDGGACVSYNGGESWSSIYNQPTGQFYHLDLDNQLPYRVYGTQQDNSSISVPSISPTGGITWPDCYVAGTGESGYIAVNPEDSNIVFVGAVGSSPGGGGALQRYDHRTKQIQLVTVWPETYTGWGAKDMVHRFPWTFPILYSPHDTGTIYVCGSNVFKTTNEGQSWEMISPDLTRADESKMQASGGPLNLDTSGAEHYCTISAFIESPHEPGVFWAGSDDGLIHLSTDGGENWRNVTPADLPEWSFVTVIEQSAHDPATVYVAATRYKLDDYRPYLFKTTDYGQSWQRIDASFPQEEITRMLREDPTVPGLLYVGTETGLFVSFDDGAHWSRVPGNLPVAPIYDMKIKGAELVIATHGRAFWILDDLNPLRTLAQEPADGVKLFPPKPTLRFWQPWGAEQAKGGGRSYRLSLGAQVTYRETITEEGQIKRTMLDSGENPPTGVPIHYLLPEGATDLTLTILDGEGNEIRTFVPKPAANGTKNGADKPKPIGPFLPTKAGFNTFLWDMRYPEPERLEGDPLVGTSVTGALAVPGHYQAQLTVNGESQTVAFEIFVDPKTGATAEDLQAQFELVQAINAKIDQTHKAIKRIRRVRGQIEHWVKQMEQGGEEDAARSAVKARGQELIKQLDAVESEFVQREAKTGFDRLRLPTMLSPKLIGLIPVVAWADAAPTQQSRDVFAKLSGEVDQHLETLNGILDEGVADFNAAVADLKSAAVVG
jgi:photosystem II stability/assembly factor-like uncharacterized protein